LSLACYVNKINNACIGGSGHTSLNDVIILTDIKQNNWSGYIIFIFIYSRLLVGGGFL